MGDRIKDWLKTFIEGGMNATRPPNVRRDLTEDDRESWYSAQDHRMTQREMRTIEDVRKLIRNINPVRWALLQRDIRWVEREMKKLGLNPEDARSIL